VTLQEFLRARDLAFRRRVVRVVGRGVLEGLAVAALAAVLVGLVVP
jgi:hypothetical protein